MSSSVFHLLFLLSKEVSDADKRTAFRLILIKSYKATETCFDLSSLLYTLSRLCIPVLLYGDSSDICRLSKFSFCRLMLELQMCEHYEKSHNGNNSKKSNGSLNMVPQHPKQLAGYNCLQNCEHFEGIQF